MEGCGVFEFGFVFFDVGVVGDEEGPEFASLDGLSEGNESGDGGEVCGVGLEFGGEAGVAVVDAECLGKAERGRRSAFLTGPSVGRSRSCRELSDPEPA